MTNTKKLKAAIEKRGISQREIARELGLSEETLSRKIHNRLEFRAGEMTRLIAILGIYAPGEIFFADEVD